MDGMMKQYAEIDDIIADVIDENDADYLQEAIRCYNAQAYRACIVMTFNAVFGSLRRFLRVLDESNLKFAAAVRKEVEERASKNQAFEGQLVELLTKQSLLDPNESDALDTIVKFRNRAAHATGADGSQDAAKLVMTLAVNYFLGPRRPLPEVRIPILLEYLKSPNFFPPEDSVEHIAAVVRSELKEINSKGRKRIIGHLVDLVKSSDKVAAENAESFLCGMAALGVDPDNADFHALLQPIYTSAVRKEKDMGVQTHGHLLSLFAVCPNLFGFVMLDDTVRLDPVLAALCRNTTFRPGDGSGRNPAWMFRSMVEALPRAELSRRFPMTLDAILENLWHDPAIASHLLKIGNGKDLFASVLTALRSPGLDEDRVMAVLLATHLELAAQIDDGDALMLIEAMSNGNLRGAVRAARDAKFLGLHRLRDKAAKFAWENVPDQMDELGLVYPPPAPRGRWNTMRSATPAVVKVSS
ncbi:hypothetical protein [Rhizobium leguminosarum]|uniref:hypothetical protein n=1 Tax=Rhizobium leguminosarum TaxID=384 RepID=UPI0003FFC7C5|nr:hypothetical protein [Rhizobium leguminosarum]